MFFSIEFSSDLVKYAVENNFDFYDSVISYSFTPLILQPTRVTLKTKTY